MTPTPMTIGFPEEWKVFLSNHPLWPEKYKLLITALSKTFIREVKMDKPADGVVFYLGRLCVEDFNEIFLLCGNGYGLGGLKILRGLYERTVTLGYIANSPNIAESFLDYHHIHKGKMLNHAEKIYDLENDVGAEEISAIRENYKRFRDKFQETDCKKCNTKKTMFSWSKLDIASMAKKIGLEGLYLPGYYYPTLQTHATPSALIERLKFKEDGGITFNESAQPDWASKALIAAHNIILYVIDFQNTYFDLHLDDEIEERKKDFTDVWGKPQNKATP